MYKTASWPLTPLSEAQSPISISIVIIREDLQYKTACFPSTPYWGTVTPVTTNRPTAVSSSDPVTCDTFLGFRGYPIWVKHNTQPTHCSPIVWSCKPWLTVTVSKKISGKTFPGFRSYKSYFDGTRWNKKTTTGLSRLKEMKQLRLSLCCM